jgi:hypothetical protein
MIKLFDYIFYIIAKFYYKWDGSSASTAIVALSLVQALLIGSVLSSIVKIYFARNETYKYSRGLGFFGVAIFAGLFFLNNSRYKNMYIPLKNKWLNEPPVQRFFKGISVLLLMLLSLGSMLFLGVI